ncbi:hypothetical protein DP804_20000 [Salmonella enterica subsp. enterica]|nr:hypothetical protein [Salmonella enterica subsp. enterica serovar Virchow]
MEFAAEEAAGIDGTSTAMASVEDSVAEKGFGTLYRYDQRQPRRVLATGFEGTSSDNHLFAAFGDKTVFSARTKKGADIFRKSAEREGLGTFFLYKINSEGLSAIDISSEFSFFEEDFLKKASEIKFNQKYQKYSSMTKYKRLGHDAFCEVIANTLREPMKSAFIPVRETHILGPVFPDRIKAVTPHFLDYLDLAW